MKKILSLLNVLTISGTTLPTTIAASPYEKQENKLEKVNLIRNKRQTTKDINLSGPYTVPTLKNNLTTINIGEIVANTPEEIIARLREVNNPIISRPEFLANITFLKITKNQAFISLERNIIIDEHIIPNSIIFTINFQTNNYTLSSITRNNNLGLLTNNNYRTIVSSFLRINGLLNNQGIFLNLEVRNITTSTAEIFVLQTNTEIIINNVRIIPNSFVRVTFNSNSYTLDSIIKNDNLGTLENNSEETILNALQILYPELKKIIHKIKIINIEENQCTLLFIPDNNSDYAEILIIYFKLNKTDYLITTKSNDNIEKETSEKQINNEKNKNLQTTAIINKIDKYNSVSKEQKQQKLNEINKKYQKLSENNKKIFKDKLKLIGLTALGSGVTVIGAKITVSDSSSGAVLSKGEGTEITPLLSEESLTATETLSVVTTEGEIIGSEAAVALAPETLGLSLVIFGLIITGANIIWWIHSDHTTVTKHESHNQYNEIEKYYKFLAHDQLKLSININKWKKIKEIYRENLNNYQEFKNKFKSEIYNFHKEDHSGWGGLISDKDIDILIKIIYNHFQEINNHFLSNNNHGWKIITNTIGAYFIIEEE